MAKIYCGKEVTEKAWFVCLGFPKAHIECEYLKNQKNGV
ncbi:hypothetical protein SAMD00020551_0602 [Mesobacillus selenatarsenatis SF-1]|uniref:Uncharacterized protein n=1 Tax=Mesobacillus selenatarsenatis (strain DSM 18680 / JCM 14380 / FERM P-15431 / SF-1) TaxID=1321606 RepID=A0A0A8X0D1_MESS1|nr:hypothetical protein SAMD00020551_0602 [Mesobacillus selenatarsenatis SF-1]